MSIRTGIAIGMVASLALAAPALAGPAQPKLLAGEKEAVIASIDGVVAKGAKWERAWSGPMTADGMTGTQSGDLLFAQEQSNSIWKLRPDGQSFVQWPYIYGAGAVSIDAAGRTFAVERTCTDPGLRPVSGACADNTRVVQLTPERKVLASAFADGKALGRLNDVQADGLGGAWYTQGGIYHVAANGTVSVVAEGGGMFTNGLVLSPDGKTLYVTNRTTIVAFDVGPDAATSNRRDFVKLDKEPTGGFGGDGMAVDNAGRLYVTAGAGIYVFDKAGKELGVIPTPRAAITLAFAGPNKQTLYAGMMGAATPEGKAWETPQGVRNVAMTVYKVKTLAVGPKDRPK
ncbi:MAG: SMP-30/gluconolactonase/LRE family protein [Sphingobium sp.]|nr:SMP-30/gluconolactonase/LRE family protein [Sphingobium sp.]